MKKALIVLATKEFQDKEYLPTREVLEDNYIEVTTAAVEKTTAIGKYGNTVDIDLSFDEVKVDDYDALILIGGKGSHSLVGNEELYRIIGEFKEQGKILAAICFAGALLADQGAVKDNRITVHDDGFEVAKGKCSALTQEPLVEDGNVITAIGPEAAKDFAHSIVKKLSS